MAGLQRSTQTFRRSGSSGLVWDERFLTEGAAALDGGAAARGRRQPELRHSRSVGSLLRRGGEPENGAKKRTKVVVLAMAKPKHNKDQQQKQEEELVVPGRKAFRTRDVAPASEPPSPRLPGCWAAPCAIFRGSGAGGSAPALARRGANNNKPRKR